MVWLGRINNGLIHTLNTHTHTTVRLAHARGDRLGWFSLTVVGSEFRHCGDGLEREKNKKYSFPDRHFIISVVQ